MRRIACLRPLIIVSCASAGIVGTAPALSGIGETQAKEFYTRKRVNGQWITGRFAKRTVGRGTASVPKRADPSATEPMSAATTATGSRAHDTASRADSASAPLAADARLLGLQRAMEARASALAAVSAPASSPGQPAVPDTTGSLTDGRSVPLSVSFDFRTGMKSTVFADGAQTTEPFDIEAMRSLASPPPGK